MLKYLEFSVCLTQCLYCSCLICWGLTDLIDFFFYQWDNSVVIIWVVVSIFWTLNICHLNVNALISTFALIQVDPMFQRMASSFDESSTAGVFLPVLFSESSRCALLFPSYFTLLQSKPSYSPPPPQTVSASPFKGNNKFFKYKDFIIANCQVDSTVPWFLFKQFFIILFFFFTFFFFSWTWSFSGKKFHLPLIGGFLLHQLESRAGQRFHIIANSLMQLSFSRGIRLPPIGSHGISWWLNVEFAFKISKWYNYFSTVADWIRSQPIRGSGKVKNLKYGDTR